MFRYRPFNLNRGVGGGGVAMSFLGKIFLSANLAENKTLYLTWAENNILKALDAWKKIVSIEEKKISQELEQIFRCTARWT